MFSPFKHVESAMRVLAARPSAERRAWFFATFLVCSILVFTFWAKMVYRNFGVAFGNAGGETTSTAADASGGNGEVSVNGLEGPLQAFRDNAETLVAGAQNLYTEIRAELFALGVSGPSAPADNTKQAPAPPVAIGAADGNIAPSGAPQVAENAAASEAGVSAESAAPPIENAGGAEGQAAGAERRGMVSGGAAQESSPQYPSAWYDNAASFVTTQLMSFRQALFALRPPLPAFSRIAGWFDSAASVVAVNLASVRQMFTDIYRYFSQ